MLTKADVEQIAKLINASEKRVTEKIETVDLKVEAVNTKLDTVKTELMDTIINTADQIMDEVGMDQRKLETRIEKVEERLYNSLCK